MFRTTRLLFFFFFNDTATTEIYTLSLHDALPISFSRCRHRHPWVRSCRARRTRVSASPPPSAAETLVRRALQLLDRKSTRLNSSHVRISYAVFCLKKKSDDFRPIELGF